MSSTIDTAADLVATGASPRRSVWGRLYHGETAIDFYGRRWWGITGSAVLIVVTIVSLFVSGLNLGIDFEGGVAWEVPAANVTTEQIDAILEERGIETAIDMTLLGRYFERYADHAVSVARRVVYIVTGSMPEPAVPVAVTG